MVESNLLSICLSVCLCHYIMAETHETYFVTVVTWFHCCIVAFLPH